MKKYGFKVQTRVCTEIFYTKTYAKKTLTQENLMGELSLKRAYCTSFYTNGSQ